MSRETKPMTPEELAAQASRVRSLATSLVRDFDRAEDVAQETCLRALTGSVRPKRSLGAYLGGIARNVAWKFGRSEARRERRERGAAQAEAQPSTLELLSRLDEQQNVLHCVRALDEPYRTTILLRFFEDLPPREIARRMDVPVETVKTRLKRGLQRLRAAMDDRHGGSRRAWLATLAPVAGLDLLPAASSMATHALETGGQIVAQASGMKMTLGVVAVLALVGGGVFTFELLGTKDKAGGAAPDLHAVDIAKEDAAEATPELAGAGGRTPPKQDTAADDAPTAGEGAPGTKEDKATADTAAGADPEAVPVDWSTVKPAVRRSPFGLPKPRGTRRGGGSWGGPTGHWTKFGLPALRKGSARLQVTVTGEDNKPVAGADVYLGPPDTAGTNGISFGDIKKLGKTNAKGVLQAEALPDGGASVFANINNRLNGPRGLDGRHGVHVMLVAKETATVAVELPLSMGAVGTVEGTVRNARGEPARTAQVRLGWQQIWTKADGAFRFEGVPAGLQTLSVGLTGHRRVAEELSVTAGGSITKEISLELSETGGLRLEGTVRGPDGEAVAGANVYFMIEKDRGTARHTRSDEAGRYVFERLPDRVAKESLRLQAGRVPFYDSQIHKLESGLKVSRLDFKLPVRYVQVQLDVVDADTGEPVEQLRVTAHRAESKRPNVHLGKGRTGTTRRGMAEAGLHMLKVDALDHENLEVPLDIKPDAEWTFKHTVKLKRVKEPTAWINLTVLLKDAVSGEVIERARIEVREKETKEALARFEGTREGGEFLMAGASGTREIAITATGYEPYVQEHELSPEPGALTLEIRLRPQ